jgi:Carboxypeptidase regulatory-like domain/TonB dependent receptor-like, beta-barrel
MKSTSVWVRSVFSLAMFMLLVYGLPTYVRAQTTNGTILGAVRDASGAGIPGVSVVVKNTETGVARSATTDSEGAYEVLSLPAGSYQVQASLQGFKTELRQGIALTVGASISVNFALSVGDVVEKIVVNEETPQVETTTSTISGVVGEAAIRELPLNGRDWLQLATLQAGVVGGLEQQSSAVSTNSRAARGNGENLYISGNRPTENLYQVDGLIVNDYANGSPGSGLNVNLGVDAVREFAVLTSDYGAQYGITSGGVVNAIFKSGTNQIHGDAFGFFRSSALDTRNVFDNADPKKGPTGTPPFHRNQYGGSIGGPIFKDKTFFFGSFEGLNQDRSISEDTLTLSDAARNGTVGNQTVTIAPSIAPYLALFPVANGADVLVKGVPDGTAHYIFSGAETGSEYYAVGKLDHNFSEQTRLSASFQWDTGSLLQPDGYNQKLVGSPSGHYNFTTSLQHSFTPTVINTARIGVSRTFAADSQDVSALSPLDTNTQLGFLPNLPVGIFTAANLSTAGGIGASGADSFHFTSYQASDDLNWIRGRHTLQFGFLFDRIDDNFNSANFPLGEWDYSTIQDLLTNTPQDFTSDLPGTNGVRGLRSDVFGFYAQDSFRVTSKLTLNYGLRYETSTPVTEANGKVATLVNLTDATPRIGGAFFNNPTKRNFAPRVGLAWDPTGSGKTSIRASFGMYDILPLPYLFINRTHGTPFFVQGNANCPCVDSNNQPLFPDALSLLQGPGAKARVAYIEANPHRAYNDQWNFTIQRQLTASTALTVGYVGSHAVHVPLGIEDMDQVPLSQVTFSPTGQPMFPIPLDPNTNPPPTLKQEVKAIQRINPNFSRIVGTLWRDYSKYNGLLVNVSKRLNHGFAIQGAYTWSKSLDQGSATFSDNEYLNTAGPSYAFLPNLQNGVSDFNITHNFTLNGTWNIPVSEGLHGAPRAILSGWEVGSIFSAHTGVPFTVKINQDLGLTGNSRVNSSAGGQRPDFNPGPGCTTNPVNPGNPTNYINYNCFSLPALGTLGDLGRNTLRGPGFVDFDFSLFRNISLYQDRYKLQFRTEAFNALNHANYGAQTTLLGSGQPLPPPTLTTSRQIQLGIKFIF